MISFLLQLCLHLELFEFSFDWCLVIGGEDLGLKLNMINNFGAMVLIPMSYILLEVAANVSIYDSVAGMESTLETCYAASMPSTNSLQR